MRPRTTLALAGAASLALLLVPLGAAAHPATRAVPRIAPPAVTVHKLVSDQVGVAQLHDPDLINPWGMAHGPNAPLWVSDNATNLSTIYTGATPGHPVAKNALKVAIPNGSPTGQVYNGTTGFTVPGTSSPALFIFAGEDGDITAWNPSVSPVTSAVAVAHEANSVFKGIALVTVNGAPRLLVANFHTGAIDVFDSSFQQVTTGPNAFRDPTLPAGYAPFNVALFNGKVYVSYAKQDAAGMDDVPGPGHGFVDVYNPGGTFVHRLVSRGALNSPWGMIIAPSTFGSLAGKLLVGNFGDGTIHAYDPSTGASLATLRDSTGAKIVIDGLWGLTHGDAAAGGAGAIWFSAGPAGETHGLLGLLTA